MKLTIVLLRPDYMAECYGKDIYVALVEADDFVHGVVKARKEVFRRDRHDGLEINHREDYEVVVIFEGHMKPAMFGWQL